MHSSPSTMNRRCLAAARDCSISGKYRASGFPDLDVRVITLPSFAPMQRKPSYLGSYCQPGPLGRAATWRASIGSHSAFLAAAIFSLGFGMNRNLRCLCGGNDLSEGVEQRALALAIIAPGRALGEQRRNGAQIESRRIQPARLMYVTEQSRAYGQPMVVKYSDLLPPGSAG